MGNGFKLKGGMFRLNTGRKFFTVSVERHWNGLAREVLDASSLEEFEDRLDGALTHLS